MEPSTVYGISKQVERCSEGHIFGVDTVAYRHPGLMLPPGGGTTDYAVYFHKALADKRKELSCHQKLNA
jgi:hypothetical protein